MNLTPKDLTKALGTGLFALFLSYGIGITYAAWTAPTVTPPNGNVMAPINTGDTTQFKNGALVVNASTTGPNRAFGLQVWEPTFLMGTTSIGSSIASAGLLLDVEGKVGATQYCDQDGNNCTTAGDVHNGSTGPIDASRLPFKKGDLLAPGDRSLVSGLAQYTTDYFNIGTLGISGTNASNVKAGVTFGPGGGIMGTMTSGIGAVTSGVFTDPWVPSFGRTDWHWNQVGNLYFNIWGSTQGGLSIFGANGSASFASYFATLAGKTAASSFGASNYGAYIGVDNGATWDTVSPANNTRSFVTAVLVN